MSLIRESCIGDIRTRSDLAAVVSRVVAIKGRADDLIGLCPFHSEKTPSFHVHPESGFFKCFGCGQGGDVIDFVRKTEGLDFTAAVEALAGRFNILIEYEDGTKGSGDGRLGPILPTPPPKAPPVPQRANSAENWESLQKRMRRGTIGELEALADRRDLCAFAGLELATRAGQLWFADYSDGGTAHPVWVVTDASRRAGQIRRLDGVKWESIGAKAKTLCRMTGDAGWPVGIADSSKPEIALVEGGPDLLAAWYFIWWKGRQDIAPMAMLGSSQTIHPEAIPLFAGRTVWVFPHYDQNDAGLIGARRWAGQLKDAASVHLYDFASHGVKDLNELVARYCVPEEEVA